MGNYRFRLSDMMPNAWFYKLKDMNNPKPQNANKKRLPSSTKSSFHQQPFHHSHSRNSFYYTPRVDHFYNSPTTTNYHRVPFSSHNTHFPPPHDPPRKSSKRSRTKRKTIYKPSPKPTLNSAQTHPESTQPQDHFFHSPKHSTDTTSPFCEPDHYDHSPSAESTHSLNELTSWSSSCSCRVSSSATDIIIDLHEKPFKKVDHNFDVFDSIPELDLPPILTKSTPQVRISSSKLKDTESSGSFSVKKVKEHNTTKSTTQSRKSVSYSNGMKLRSNSPRIELISKKVIASHGGQARKSFKSSSVQRKSFSKSMAIVKSSFDPQKDFRDSMVEMIVENNIKASQDLEELLACYLALNSDEYHDLIVKAFEQIWFSLPSF